MGKMLSALTPKTPKKLLINEAVILESFDFVKPLQDNLIESNILSATRGGVTVNLVPTIRQTAIDGARLHTSDLLNVDDWEANAATSILELSVKNLLKSVAFADEEPVEGGITRLKPRYKVKPADFKDYFIIGEIGSNNIGVNEGALIVFVLNNCVNTVGAVIATTEKGEAVVPLTLTAHNKISTQAEPPFAIYIIPTTEVAGAPIRQDIEG